MNREIAEGYVDRYFEDSEWIAGGGDFKFWSNDFSEIEVTEIFGVPHIECTGLEIINTVEFDFIIPPSYDKFKSIMDLVIIR